MKRQRLRLTEKLVLLLLPALILVPVFLAVAFYPAAIIYGWVILAPLLAIAYVGITLAERRRHRTAIRAMEDERLPDGVARFPSKEPTS